MRQQFDDDLMDAKRREGDPEVDRFVADQFADPAKKAALQAALKNVVNNDALAEFQLLYPGYEFLNRSLQLPAFAEPRKMETGAIFFSRHSEMIMSLLGLMSLPYCYNAANGAMVLYLSEKIRKDTTRRLFDTALFVWDVMAPNAFATGGKGFSEILKVRVMHAAVRYYMLNSRQWDDAWGVPVNQEDMAGTNLAFSLIVIRGLRLLGSRFSREEAEAFLHLWKVIGFLTGLPQVLIPENMAMAEEMDRVIKARQFKSSAHGRELTESLTRHILSVNQTKATAHDILGLMRYLLGKDISDQLAIAVPDLAPYKIRLIRTLNLFKSFLPKGDPETNYYRAHRIFIAQGNEALKQKLTNSIGQT